MSSIQNLLDKCFRILSRTINNSSCDGDEENFEVEDTDENYGFEPDYEGINESQHRAFFSNKSQFGLPQDDKSCKSNLAHCSSFILDKKNMLRADIIKLLKTHQIHNDSQEEETDKFLDKILGISA